MIDLSVPIPSLSQVLTRLLCATLVSAVLGWSVAWLAGRFGDPGPGYDGRKTLNPFPHLDLVAILHAVFFRAVWIKPVAVEGSLLRGGWFGRLSVVGGSSLLLAAASAAALALRTLAVSTFPGSAGITASLLLSTFADLAVVTALINLLPLSPLVGALLLPLGAGTAKALAKPIAYWVTCAVLIIVALSGVTPRVATAVAAAWRSLLGY